MITKRKATGRLVLKKLRIQEDVLNILGGRGDRAMVRPLLLSLAQLKAQIKAIACFTTHGAIGTVKQNPCR